MSYTKYFLIYILHSVPEYRWLTSLGNQPKGKKQRLLHPNFKNKGHGGDVMSDVHISMEQGCSEIRDIHYSLPGGTRKRVISQATWLGFVMVSPQRTFNTLKTLEGGQLGGHFVCSVMKRSLDMEQVSGST